LALVVGHFGGHADVESQEQLTLALFTLHGHAFSLDAPASLRVYELVKAISD